MTPEQTGGLSIKPFREERVTILDWPEETIPAGGDIPGWTHAGSNLLLDFHGDPTAARLAVFSDGNHHMALAEALAAFYRRNPAVKEIFYATTPPGPLVQLATGGRLRIGNFTLAVRPHVFISPPHVLDGLVEKGLMHAHWPFVRNQGSVLLVRRGNPANIRNAADLAREGVRLFISNPRAERVSYQGYADTLSALAAREGGDLGFIAPDSGDPRVVFGTAIHHREAPRAVAAGQADAAVVYYHLALRYTRIFPDMFDIVPLGGTAVDPQPFEGNVIGHTHVGIVGDGGSWGRRLVGFLLSDTAGDIYRGHGLLPLE